jgi:hypothetical protein
MTRKNLFQGILVFSILLLTACSLASPQIKQESIPNTGSESGISNSSQTDNESLFDGSSLSCFDAEGFILMADHTLTVNQTDTSITHILKQGGIALTRDDNSQMGDYNLSTASPQNLNFEVIGTVGPCEIEANGIMLLSATGYCLDGIVYLTITESWQPANGTITCKDVVNSFTLPGYQAVHIGPYGMGEEFLVINDPNGYTVMREFLEGEGYHSWTLTTDIAPVPLAPDNK